MEIYLVRHGIAEDPHEAERDSARALTPEGREKTALVAKAFHKNVSSLDIILHSPFLRAKETAEIFAREFDGAELKVCADFTPESDPQAGAETLEKYGRLRRVMVVSHEPFISSLASVLLTGHGNASLPFKKAGICAMEWGGAGGSSLLYFVPPKILLD